MYKASLFFMVSSDVLMNVQYRVYEPGCAYPGGAGLVFTIHATPAVVISVSTLQTLDQQRVPTGIHTRVVRNCNKQPAPQSHWTNGCGGTVEERVL